MRDKRVARLLFYPVQYNPVSETLIVHKSYRVHIAFHFSATDAIKTTLTNSYQAAVDTATSDGVFDNIYQSCLLNPQPSSVAASSLTRQALSTLTAIESVQSEGSPYAVKATIESAGI